MTHDLVVAARRYKGTPHRHMGRSIHGIDCLGLIICAAKDAGYQIADTPDKYRTLPRTDRIDRELSEQATRIDHGDQRVGDIVTMWFQQSNKLSQHLLILTPIGVIHSDASVPATRSLPKGRVVEHAISPKLSERFNSFYRLEK